MAESASSARPEAGSDAGPGAAGPGVWGPRLLTLGLALAVPLAAVALNVHLLASEAWLGLELGRPGFPAAPGFTAAERWAVAVPSTLFIVGDDPPSVLSGLGPSGARLYEDEEIDHLLDVRRLVGRLRTAGLVAGLGLLAALVWAWRRPAWRRAVGRGLAAGGALAVGLVVAAGLGIGGAWDWLFTTFHEVLFPPGTWQFAAESGLIRLFPVQFWYDTALALAALALVEGLVAMAVGRRLARPPRH